MQAASSRRVFGASSTVLNNREEFSGVTVNANMIHPLRKQMPFPVTQHDAARSQLARLYGNVRSGPGVRCIQRARSSAGAMHTLRDAGTGRSSSAPGSRCQNAQPRSARERT